MSDENRDQIYHHAKFPKKVELHDLLLTWTMIPSSTMDDLAVRFAVDFSAPLKTTKEAPVTFRS
jgi:hypothetical protein